jgi:thiol-disulfide isomerase/thioredoxin
MVKMKFKIKIILFVLYASICLLSGYFGWKIQMALVCSASFLTFYFLRNENLLTNLIFLIPNLIFSFYGFELHLHVLPIKVFPFLAFLSFRFLKNELNGSTISLISLLLFSLGFFGMGTYLNWENNLPYKTSIDKPFDYQLYNSDSIDIKNSILNSDSLIVFDGWTVNCGICFKKMPEFNILKEKFKNEKVAFFTLNFPTEDSSLIIAKKRIEKFNPNGRNLFTRNNKIWEELNIKGVPVYFLIKNKQILYLGHTEISKIQVGENLEDKIKFALKP